MSAKLSPEALNLIRKDNMDRFSNWFKKDKILLAAQGKKKRIVFITGECSRFRTHAQYDS